MRHVLMALLLLLSWWGAVLAGTQSFDLGPFGEVPVWLAAYVPPRASADKDPLEGIEGEARFLALSDPKLQPVGGRTLELPGQRPGEPAAVTWKLTRVMPPDCPNIWSEFPRLNVLLGENGRGIGGTAYLYCRLVSPQDAPGGLIVGCHNGRFFLNGKELGSVSNRSEDATELPVQLRKGANHLVVRVSGPGPLSCRLVGPQAEPLKSVKVELDAAPKTPVAPGVLASDCPSLLKLAGELGALSPPEHPEALGANLARTMALLEAGKYTHRPVRIVFYGQSIETGWPDLLIQRLRERFPSTAIVYENRAIGGWFVWRLLRSLKHDILRWQPDLVLFSAYQGCAEVWERPLSDLRRETTADILIRTQHLCGRDDPDAPDDGPETLTLRRRDGA